MRSLVATVLGAVLAGSALTALPASALSGSEPVRLHDPSAITVGECTYAFSTGFENDPANPTGSVTQYRSCDEDAVTGWSKVGNLWSTTPAWITQALGRTPPNIWAPDVNYFNGQYHVYYGASVWGTADAVMGLLTSPSPTGPWTDRGMVTDVNYPIDPDVVRGEDGQLYVSWGSWTGGASYLHAIDENTGKLSTTDTELSRVAVGVEGVSIVQQGDYFYMFGSKGSCCSGVNSTYYTSVARATSVRGPYLDINGTSMLDGGGARVLSGYGSKIAAGGGDVFLDGDAVKFAYHYYDGDANGRETLDIRPIRWEEGWPVFEAPIGSIFATTDVTISGRPVVGQPLVGSPPVFDKPEVTTSYQWLRDGAPIDGATQQDYTPTAADIDASLTLRATGSRAGFDSAVSTSNALTVVEQPALAAGIAEAQARDLSGYTLGSAEAFRRAVAEIAAAAEEPGVDEQPLRDALTDASSLLVSDETLLSPLPVERSWVVASSPAYGNGESPEANGWRLFDGDLTTNVDTTSPNGWVQVTAPTGSTIDVTRLQIYPRAGWLAQRIVGHRFQGSNDGGATWQTFATVTSATDGEWTTIDLPETASYARIRMVDDHGGYTNAAEARLVMRSADASLLDLYLEDVDGLDAADYTRASWAAVASAVTDAEAVDRTDASAIEQATRALRTAIDGLASGTPVVEATVREGEEGDNGWFLGRTVVGLELADGEGTIEYRLDGGDWVAYTRPVVVADDGSHRIEYRAVRDGRVVDSSAGSVDVGIDSTAPVTVVERSPKSGTAPAGRTATVTFSSTDATSGVASIEYSVNGGDWTVADISASDARANAAAPSVTFAQVGRYVVAYRSTDAAGNTEATRTTTVRVAGAPTPHGVSGSAVTPR